MHAGHDMKAALIGGSIGGAVALVVVVWCVQDFGYRMRQFYRGGRINAVTTVTTKYRENFE